MPRPEKVQAVTDIQERLEAAEAVFLTEYRGLTVKEVQSLRASLRASDADYKVVKMTLAKRAAEKAGLANVDDYLMGPTAIAFAKSDPVATAKALRDFAKANDKFILKVGVLSGNLLKPEEITRLAEIEPREVLLAKIAGVMKAPLSKAAGMMGAFTRDAATMFQQLLEKREAGDTAAPDPETAASAEEE